MHYSILILFYTLRTLEVIIIYPLINFKLFLVLFLLEIINNTKILITHDIKNFKKNPSPTNGHARSQDVNAFTFPPLKDKLFSALNNSDQLYIGNKDKIKDTKKLVINFTSFSLKFYLIYL